MKLALRKKLFLCFLFMSTPLWLHAQLRQQVAIVPFWGEDAAIINQFGEELIIAVDSKQDFRSFAVDMINLPPDVPEGGFPPFICPMPSLTRASPFALTGEVTFDDELERWHLRLFLWQMSDARLIFSDELTAFDRVECAANLPALLTWLFSWIPRDEPPAVVARHGRIVYFAANEPLRWLYAGLRVGGAINFDTTSVAARDYLNYNVAAYVNVKFLNSLGIQIEALYKHEVDPIDIHSMLVPCLLRYSFRRGTMFVAGLAGVYLSFPLDNFDAEHIFGGITAGLKFGTRLGPGSIFASFRHFYDLREPTPNHMRNTINISIGYELGFLPKR